MVKRIHNPVAGHLAAAFVDANLKVPAVLTAAVAKTGKPMAVGSIESRLGKPLNSYITCLAMQDSKRIQRYRTSVEAADAAKASGTMAGGGGVGNAMAAIGAAMGRGSQSPAKRQKPG